MRLRYKAGKTGKYWPGVPAATRKANLLAEWHKIVAALDREVSGVAAVMGEVPDGAGGAELKAYEDRLDAVICAWIGICILNGAADPFGSDTSAIWIPKSV